MSLLSPACALELGSTMTRVWEVGSSNVMTMPTPQGLLPDGRAADDLRLGSFLHQMFFPASRSWLVNLVRPRVVAAVPGFLTAVETQAVVRAIHAGGAVGTQLVLTALAAASGAGLDLTSAHAFLLLGCEDEWSGLTVLVAGEQYQEHELICHTRALSERLCTRIKHDLNVTLDAVSLQKLIAVAPVLGSLVRDLRIPGKNTRTGKASEVLIPSQLLRETAEVFFREQCVMIERQLNRLGATFAADILEQGLLLYGAGTQLPWLSLFMATELRIPVSIMPEPELCVIKGLHELASSISIPELNDDPEASQIIGNIK